MRKIRSPQLPDTSRIRDQFVAQFATDLNNELDNLRRDINKYVGKTVITSAEAALTLTADNDAVFCDGTFTVTLPMASSSDGNNYLIKNIGSGVITVDGNGSDTIDGAATQSLSSQYDFIAIVSDGTEWFIISE